MKMISAGAGLGVGVKDYRVIFVFETIKPLRNSSTPDGQVQRRRMRPPRRASRAQLTRERLRLHRVYGSTRSTRMAWPSS